MDNITHSLVGAVLGQTGLKRKTRKGMAALVLGANGPDIDVFLGWVGWLPLATHRGFTHGLIGALIVMPLVVAGFLWALDIYQQRRGDDFAGKPPLDPLWLLGLSFIGNLTHPLLDWQTTYAVQLLSPFSTVWYHTDTLFIIDLVLLLLLGGSFWHSRRREKLGAEWRRPAVTALATVVAYIGVNGLITMQAKAAGHALKRGPVDRIVAGPPPLAFWRRDVVWLSGGRYGRSTFDFMEAQAFTPEERDQPTGMRNPLVDEAIAASPAVQRFLRWSIMPFATIRRERCRASVTFNDARYSDGLSRGNFEHVVILATPGEDCP